MEQLVIVERSFAEPVDAAGFAALRSSACESRRGARLAPAHAWLASDGRHAVDFYEGDDAAAAALGEALSARGEPFDRVWSGRWVPPSPMLGEPPAGASLVVVQREFPASLSLEQIYAVKQSAAGCNQVHRVEGRDTFRGSDGCLVVCSFFAPDAEAVRTAQRQNDIPFVRAWSARLLDA